MAETEFNLEMLNHPSFQPLMLVHENSKGLFFMKSSSQTSVPHMVPSAGVYQATKPHNRKGRVFSGQSLRLSSITNLQNRMFEGAISVHRFDRPNQLKNNDPY